MDILEVGVADTSAMIKNLQSIKNKTLLTICALHLSIVVIVCLRTAVVVKLTVGTDTRWRCSASMWKISNNAIQSNPRYNRTSLSPPFARMNWAFKFCAKQAQ